MTASFGITKSLAEKYSVDEIRGGIQMAIRDRNTTALTALLTLLAAINPHEAEMAMDATKDGLAAVTR